MAQASDSSPFPVEAGPNGNMNGHPDEDVQMGNSEAAGSNEAAFTANGEIAHAPAAPSRLDGQEYPLAGSTPLQHPVDGTTEPAPTPQPSAPPTAYTTTLAPSPYPPQSLPQAQAQQTSTAQPQPQQPPLPSARPPTATFQTSTTPHPPPSQPQMPALASTSANTKLEAPSGHAIPSTQPNGSPARVYLNSKVTPVLMEGMKYLAKHEPERPLEWLGRFLGERSRLLEGPAPIAKGEVEDGGPQNAG